MPALEVLDLTPMVIAVQVREDGQAWAGRVGSWVRGDDGWWADVSPEQDHYRAGRRPGWIHIDALKPAQHEIRTTFQTWEWWGWSEPVWPTGLTRFAEAAWNRAEHEHAEAVRPARPAPES